MSGILSDAHGRYTGTGRWADAQGDSHGYKVELELTPEGEHGLWLRFRHVFTEEQTPDVVMQIPLQVTAPGILTFELAGMPQGLGYYTETALHFTLPVQNAAVEATHIFGNGGCHVLGSSQKNSLGRYIMWEEHLRRA
ncbi:hypothetical protein FHY55_00645 [Oceanicola sp. D3]|uniref:hypothetical protein n=1 Tax=Oceanicola sp. D3 TaxID=2587163 RepID=UPI00112481CD|nr:hypothetical protein [Oceanicola sp. D3]QDC07842.1 hypothetical protein FHY55_00645 [Oceanicola sp. D3]